MNGNKTDDAVIAKNKSLERYFLNKFFELSYIREEIQKSENLCVRLCEMAFYLVFVAFSRLMFFIKQNLMFENMRFCFTCTLRRIY